jgi:hypothetical protein
LVDFRRASRLKIFWPRTRHRCRRSCGSLTPVVARWPHSTHHQQFVHTRSLHAQQSHIIDRRRETLASVAEYGFARDIHRMRIYFDCALHDTHWPIFFRNLESIACKERFGGRVSSTVSSLHIGDLPKALRLSRTANGDARGCTNE